MNRRVRLGAQIFRLASEKSAGILTDFKLFSRSPDGIYAAKTCVQIQSEVPIVKQVGLNRQNFGKFFGFSSSKKLWQGPLGENGSALD